MAASGVTPPAPNGDITSDPAWVVQKFGGTSVGKFATNIVEQIILYVVLPVLGVLIPSRALQLPL